MQTFISFLRGVNMTGHNSIRMNDLTALYNNLGFLDSKTYIQSGNVIFSCNKNSSPEAIALSIEKAILEKFSYTVPVMLRTITELKGIMESNPFVAEENFDPAKSAVIFLYDKVTEFQIQKVAGVNYPPDKFQIIGNEIYTFCPDGFGKTKLYTNFFENKMKVTGTARNWKTITAILNLAEKRI
jgi:uncharacterized protein (DUF1697 family)